MAEFGTWEQLSSQVGSDFRVAPAELRKAGASGFPAWQRDSLRRSSTGETTQLVLPAVVSEDFGDVLKEGFRALDLADEAVCEYRILGNLIDARDDDDRQPRATCSQFFGQLGPHNVGHHLVREDEIDVMLVEQLQCLDRRDCGKNRLPLLG